MEERNQQPIIIKKVEQVIQSVAEQRFFGSDRICFTIFHPFIFLRKQVSEEDFAQGLFDYSSPSHDTSQTSITYPF